jgi:hypothetical protein
MNLTQEQMEAVDRSEAVRVAEGERQLVVLRADVYERVRGAIYDDSPWTEEERRFLIRHVGERAGWDDPAFDVYEK